MTKRKSEEFGARMVNAPGDDEDTDEKIRKVIENTLDEEISYKKFELEKINERIFEAQNMLDKLRVCIVCNFYSQNGRLTQPEYINHPAVKSLKCEHLEMAISHARAIEPTKNPVNEPMVNEPSVGGQSIGFTQQYEVKICVGNVSKYLTGDAGIEAGQKPPTHKWMVYIRSPDCPRLENYIKKVIFFLHSSYKPNDIVEIKSPPFELTKRGWGEFPVQAQIHFKDARNKRLDVMHPIKLDWTQTGLQTFGGETIANAKLILKPADFVLDSKQAPVVQSSSEMSINSNCVITDNGVKITTDRDSNSICDEKSKIGSLKTVDSKPELGLNSDTNSLAGVNNPTQNKLIAGRIGNSDNVIYKIQPSDTVNKPATTNSFIQSLKPAQVQSTGLTTIKKFKLSADQMTKIKLSSPFIKSEPDSIQVDANKEPETDKLIYSVDYLTKFLNTEPSYFEKVLKKNLPRCPLVAENRKLLRGISAATIHEYYSWPFAKRKAREWMRAVRLKETCIKENPMDVWSTKRIVTWLRGNGYSPLEYKNLKLIEPVEDNDGYVNSYSSITQILAVSFSGLGLGEDEEHVDIVDDIPLPKPGGLKKSRCEVEKIEKERNTSEDSEFIELTTAEKYIEEELFKLQLKTNTVNILPTNETIQTPSNLVRCNLVEKFLCALFKRFANDLIRQTCSDLYFEPNSTNEHTSSMHPSQKFPLYLGVKDVYRTIMKHDRYDFLTNKYMDIGNESDPVVKTQPACLNYRNNKLKKNFSDSSLINK